MNSAFSRARSAILTAAVTPLISVSAQPTSWVLRDDAPGPGARAYDSARARVVALQGGVLWEWDGEFWARRSVAPGRFGLAAPALAYHAGSAVTLMVGDDVRSWDGLAWQVYGTPGPGARDEAAMVYDASRDRVVLFGGTSGDARTWTWDGTRWTAHADGQAPSPRRGHAMAYDSARDRVVLAGGFDYAGNLLSDTWEWDGGQWRQRAVTGLAPLAHAAIAYDPVRRRTVLRDPNVGTWEWDGTGWAQLGTLGPHPGSRSGNAAVWFPPRQSVVLLRADEAWHWDGVQWQQPDPTARPLGLSYGFYDADRQQVVAPVLRETWLWDGARWRRQGPSPVAPLNPGIAYDPLRRQGLAFGGDNGGQPTADTFAWDGTQWTLLSPAQSPPATRFAALAWDSVRGQVIALVPEPGQTVGRQQWRFDGSTWSQDLGAMPPPHVFQRELISDTVRGRIVHTGFDGTWEWDGTTWQQIDATAQSVSAQIAFDAVRGRTLAMQRGGVHEWDGAVWTPPSGGSFTPFIDNLFVFDAALQHAIGYDDFSDRTWAYGALSPAAVSTYGAPCAGSARPTRIAAWGLPSLGSDAFALDVLASGGPQPAALFLALAAGQRALPNGCSLLLDPARLLLHVPATTNAAGFWTTRIEIPPAPILAGFQVFGQAAVLDPSFAGGLQTTPGVDVRIGH